MKSLGKFKLEDLTTKIGSGATPRGGKNSYKESGISLIRSLNVYDLEFDKDGLAFIDQDQAENLSNVEVEEDDVLINITGASVARCCKVPKDILPARVNQHVSILRPKKDKLDPAYLQYLLVSPYYKHKLLTFAQGGATREALTKGGLEEFEIELPPLDTQRRIASILSAFDDLIENNTRRIEILEEMARRIYREWFVHFRFPSAQGSGEQAIPAREKPKLVDSGTELGEIPEGWEVRKLEDLCELTLGQSPKSEFYNEKGVGLPFHQGVKDFGARYPTTIIWCSKIKRVAEEGDILFSVRAPVGRINIANTKMVIGRGLHAIRSKFGNQVFIFHQLKDKFQEEDTMGGGTIFKSVTKKDMLNLKLLDPGQELIGDFEEKVGPIDNQIKVLTEKNIVLKETRDWLLPKLILGKIDVEDITITLNPQAIYKKSQKRG